MKTYLSTYATSMTQAERERMPVELMFNLAQSGEIKWLETTINGKFKEEALAVLNSSDSFERFVDRWEAKIKDLGLNTQSPPPRPSKEWRRRYVPGILGKPLF